MQTIIVEPAQLELVASRIESSNGEYQRVYRSLYSEVDKMSSSWSGKENVEFSNKIRGFEMDFRQISLILNQYAEFLRNTARAYRETQEELYSSAARLKTGGGL